MLEHSCPGYAYYFYYSVVSYQSVVNFYILAFSKNSNGIRYVAHKTLYVYSLLMNKHFENSRFMKKHQTNRKELS